MAPTLPERALAGLGEGLRGLAGPLLDPLVRGLAAPLQVIDELLDVPATTEQGGTATAGQAIPAVFDLERTPHPEYHAQLAGIDPATAIGPGATADQVRDYVRRRGLARRGTPEAIRAAAQSALTGAARVVLIERDGSPWRLRVVTYSGQTPDPDAVMRAVLTEKPLGIVVVHEIALGQDYADTTAEAKTYAAHTTPARTYRQRSEVLGG